MNKYFRRELRDRLTVGHRPLEASILVRIQVPQPSAEKNISWYLGSAPKAHPPPAESLPRGTTRDRFFRPPHNQGIGSAPGSKSVPLTPFHLR